MGRGSNLLRCREKKRETLCLAMLLSNVVCVCVRWIKLPSIAISALRSAHPKVAVAAAAAAVVPCSMTGGIFLCFLLSFFNFDQREQQQQQQLRLIVTSVWCVCPVFSSTNNCFSVATSAAAALNCALSHSAGWNIGSRCCCLSDTGHFGVQNWLPDSSPRWCIVQNTSEHPNRISLVWFALPLLPWTTTIATVH